MDLSRIKQKMQDLERQGQSNSKMIFKPAEGSTVIRIVPYMHDREFPFLEMYFYYEFGKKTYVSPLSYNQPDPVHEFVTTLKESGDKDAWNQARKIEAKMRTFVPVIVRGKEEEGIKMFGFGKTVYQELLGILDDPDYGDITDLKTGRDITVEYKKGAGKDFAKTTIRVKPNQSPATASKDVLKAIKEMPTAEEIWPMATYEELSTALERYLSNEDEAADESAANDTVTSPDLDLDLDDEIAESDLPFDKPAAKETKAPAKPKADPKPAPAKSSPKAAKQEEIASSASTDIDAAFEDMFND